MSFRLLFRLCAVVAASLCIAADTLPSPFLVKPYLQLGDAATAQSRERLWVLWHTPDQSVSWRAEVREKRAGSWKKAKVNVVRTVNAAGIEPHRVMGAALQDLTAGKEHEYRILLDGKAVFESEFRARKSAGTPFRFVVTGDCAAGTAEQKQLALQAYNAKPDFAAIAGDIVYSRGRISEYREKYFPIYNADTASAATGAPLIRSTLLLAAPGNHDVGGADLAVNPDGLAYFLYWAQPLNGPLGSITDAGAPVAKGTPAVVDPFLKSAGSQFPRMANFSFDYGDSHWTVIDSNRYADWSRPELLDWLKRDLAAAQKARWRFVLYHHPGFNSSVAHFEDQWMRWVAPVFEQGKVDIVFAGHVHNYQRSYPLRFVPASAAWLGRVDGNWTLDRSYDGASKTKPRGVIYLVTGAGGARRYNPEQETNTASWQDFTAKFVSTVNSITVVDAEGSKLSVRQVDQNGKEVDRFEITR
jgi:hypothetical protein